MWTSNGVHKGQKGITGLETAIILIAFVVVASIFAYTVLSAGLFSSQKSQEAVYSGLKQAQSSLVLKGAVVATAEPGHTGAAGYVGSITFTVGAPTGSEPLDFTAPTPSGSHDGLAANDTSAANSVVISYVDADQKVNNVVWTKVFGGKNNGDEMLDAGRKYPDYHRRGDARRRRHRQPDRCPDYPLGGEQDFHHRSPGGQGRSADVFEDNPGHR